MYYNHYQSRADHFQSQLLTLYSFHAVFSTLMDDSQFKDMETQPIEFDPVLHAPPRFEPPKPPEPQ